MQRYSVVVELRITAEELLRYYRGSAKTVSATDTTGRKVRFPVNIVQPFVTRDGIDGVFEIHFDELGKFTRINKLA